MLKDPERVVQQESVYDVRDHDVIGGKVVISQTPRGVTVTKSGHLGKDRGWCIEG